ncbi:translocation/assembly module TamB domain-containing protein [Citreimonas salinaria]|uniref:Autotransporter secretion inner membrane protein TamB n=1 Tax=Citreimonas salinaria TaxID=321339 RepID=A0A1H3J6G3_9RHOB|nr:translocation/assembly module TamB domain-containing protein [Citreimonas salinaria]SDY35492.1 autotransporter secretion inner membrane protein TamB [Citreimonas salinaria]
MRYILAFLLLLPMAAAAQNDDRGFIQGLLEDALSTEGRSVSIQGFEGALSSRATIERITVSDPQGVWLSAEDIALVWSRSALLRRRVEIDEISIGLLELRRPPVPVDGDGLPSPEASEPFTLPELPLAIRLADLTIDRAEIGAPVLGEDAAFSVDGSAILEGGEGEVELAVERLDAPASLQLAGSFENATRALELNLELREPQGGLVAERIDLPEGQSLSLTLDGDGTLSDFEAALSLQTGGEPRLTGTLALQETESGAQGFEVDVDGNLAPLLAPEYRDFLGDSITLVASGARLPDGTITLDKLALEAAALELSGSAQIGADGWPERFNLDAAITPVAGEDTVLLPLGGPQTRLGEAQLSAQYDRADSDTWQLSGTVRDFVRDSVEIGRVALDGTGRIEPEAGSVTGTLELNTDELSLGNPELDQAVGTTLAGELAFDWQPGEPLSITGIDLGGSDYGVTGSLTVNGLEDQLGIRIAPNLEINADRLARFAPLTGLDLAGAAELAVNGRITPLTGAFDLNLRGTTQDLTTGIERLDPLLSGEAVVEVNAVRNERGFQVAPLRVQTEALRLEATGQLGGDDGSLSLDLRLTETGDVIPGLSGVTTLSAEATQQPSGWQVSVSGDAPGQTILRYDGTIEPDTADGPFLSGTLEAAIGELSAFSDLAGRPLSGAINLTATGNAAPAAPSFDIVAEAVATDLNLGIEALAPLLEGRTEIMLDAALDADGTLVIDSLELDGRSLSGSVDGRIADSGGAVAMDLRLADIGLLAPQLSGPVTLEGTAQSDGGPWTVDIDAGGPGGIAATIDGTIEPDTPQGPRFEGAIDASIDQLSALSRIAGRPLGGAVSLTATGTVTPQAPAFDLETEIVARDLSLGLADVDSLLRGRTEIALDAALTEDGLLAIETLRVDGQQITASVDGQFSGTTANLDIDARLANLGVLVPQFPGAVSISGTARSDGGPFRVDLDTDGPGGINAAVDGTVARDVSSVNLSIDGNAPLALANPFIAPRTLEGTAQFDLSVNGRPALSSVSGTVTTANGQLALPTLGLALENIDATARLNGERAQVDLTAALASGGSVTVQGPIGLSAPYNADLAIRLRNAELRDPQLYETEADARLTLSGPLTGPARARIAGTVTLDEAELRIPQIGPSYEILEGLRHVNPPADVRRTLQFAGLRPSGEAERPSDVGFPVDLVIEAPDRIFVRGRGLDAELGGTLRLTGTTTDLVPVGQFDLIRGRLDLLGQRLTLDEGSVALRGSFDPVVNFVARAEAEGTEIRIAITGFASSPELTITSSPDLPQDEALALLLFGRDAGSLSALQALQLAAAVRTLSGRGGLGLTEQLRSGLGVDDFDISTDAEGNAEARVGAYISRNIYTGVTVGSDGESAVTLNLDVTDDVTVRGRAGSDGDTALGIYFERDY